MLNDVTLDEMFPRAVPVFHPPLPQLKVRSVYERIGQHAKNRQLDLTHEHHEVIDFVLDFYEHCDDCENARALADLLQREFAAEGGRKYLYRLFPDGPLSTIHDLADLPPLPNQADRSFGTRF